MEARMTNQKTPTNSGSNTGVAAEASSDPAAETVGPLFAVSQPEAGSTSDAASPYPWDEHGESVPSAETGAPDDLPGAAEIFDPAAPSVAAGRTVNDTQRRKAH